jgi:hypothetical protein
MQCLSQIRYNGVVLVHVEMYVTDHLHSSVLGFVLDRFSITEYKIYLLIDDDRKAILKLSRA